MKKPLAMLAALLILSWGCGPSSPPTDPHEGHDHSSPEGSEKGHEGHDHGDEGADDHGHEEESSHAGDPIELTDEQRDLAKIETQKASFSVAPLGISAPGSISVITGQSAAVTPSASGRLSELKVTLGQKVAKGQVLGALESSELAEAYSRITSAVQAHDEAKARVKDEENQVKLSQAKAASAEQTLKRQKEFAEAGAFSQAPLQAARSELNEAESELLGNQKEQASHADQLRRMESLYREGLVSRLELEAARLEAQQDVIKVDRAKSRVSLARAAFTREEGIAKRGLLNSREVQTAEADLRSAKLEWERAKSVLQSSRERLGSSQKAAANAQAFYQAVSGGTGASGGRARLVAPISGVVTQVEATKGQAVDRTQTLIVIENLESVWATAQVSEREASLVRLGMTANITSQSHPGRSFAGNVQVIGSRIDPKTRSLPVQCLITNAEGRLKPGMFIQSFIQLDRGLRVLSVPSSAVVLEDQEAFVFVLEGGKFTRHPVILGREFEGRHEILKGLEEGDEVAIKGAFILNSQAKKEELKGHEH